MTLVELAYKLRPLIEYAAQGLTDKDASQGVQLFPKLKHDGTLVKAGTRINWHDQLKRAAVDLWDTDSNNPDNAPALWEDIAYIDGVRIIPETITATLAFALDELGWWDGKVYRSKRNGNVFTPAVTPEWWEEVKEVKEHA